MQGVVRFLALFRPFSFLTLFFTPASYASLSYQTFSLPLFLTCQPSFICQPVLASPYLCYVIHQEPTFATITHGRFPSLPACFIHDPYILVDSFLVSLHVFLASHLRQPPFITATYPASLTVIFYSSFPPFDNTLTVYIISQLYPTPYPHAVSLTSICLPFKPPCSTFLVHISLRCSTSAALTSCEPPPLFYNLIRPFLPHGLLFGHVTPPVLPFPFLHFQVHVWSWTDARALFRRSCLKLQLQRMHPD